LLFPTWKDYSIVSLLAKDINSAFPEPTVQIAKGGLV